MTDSYSHKIRRSSRIVSILLLLVIGAMCVGTIVYTRFIQKQLYAAWASQLAQTEATTALSDNLYLYIKLAPTQKPLLVLPYFEYSRNRGLWVLANRTNVIDQNYVPKNLANLLIPEHNESNRMLVRTELTKPLADMYAAAQKDGIQLMVLSAYRSYAEQKILKQRNINNLLVAEPGQSEHQTGLAIDFSSSPPDCVENCYLDAATADWLAKNAADYGFILRYPADKSTITGYPAESWHYRYVGKSLAQAMVSAGLTFEETHALIGKAQPRQTYNN